MVSSVSSSLFSLIILGSGTMRRAKFHTDSSNVAEKSNIWQVNGSILGSKGRQRSVKWLRLKADYWACIHFRLILTSGCGCYGPGDPVWQSWHRPHPAQTLWSSLGQWTSVLRTSPAWFQVCQLQSAPAACCHAALKGAAKMVQSN